MRRAEMQGRSSWSNWPVCAWSCHSDPIDGDTSWTSINHPSKPVCAACAETPVINTKHTHARLEPLLRITPGSEQHCLLEAAFYVLACGLYAPDELRAMNDIAGDKREAQGMRRLGERSRRCA